MSIDFKYENFLCRLWNLYGNGAQKMSTRDKCVTKKDTLDRNDEKKNCCNVGYSSCLYISESKNAARHNERHNEKYKKKGRAELSLIEYEKKNHLVTVTMNRPEKMNALSEEMFIDLRNAWAKYEADDDAWLAIITGKGKAFCSGGDTKMFADGLKGGDFLSYLADITARDPLIGGHLTKPTMSVINGYALGGGFDMVLGTDLRIASESAKMQITEVKINGFLMLWDNLPYAQAAELLSGAMITGRRAFEMGIVNRVAPEEQLWDTAMEMAEDILSRPPQAVYHHLKALREMKRASVPMPSQWLHEYSFAVGRSLSHTEDWKEANSALLERRKPEFKNK